MEKELKYARMLIVINHQAPSTLDLINIPYEVAVSFVGDVERHGTDYTRSCSMEYETPVGTKRFSTRVGDVVAIDVMFTVEPVTRNNAHPEPDFVEGDDRVELYAPEEDEPVAEIEDAEGGLDLAYDATSPCEVQESDMRTPSTAVYCGDSPD